MSVAASAALELVDRRVVFDTLDGMLQSACRDKRSVGVLVVRVENLRSITLGRGYAAGSELLAEAGRRIAAVARARDWIRRIGDQDFVLLLPGILGSGQLLLCANKLLNGGQAGAPRDDDAVPLTLRLGGAAGPEHGADAQHLLLAAEQAAARAEERMVPLEIYSPPPENAPAADWQIEELFEGAFERGEFELHYQPKIDLPTGRVVGAEALSRWTSAERGSISPAVFIPVAERSGHIERLTWSTINAALQQSVGWRSAGRDLRIAVNLSPWLLDRDEVSERVQNALKLWNCPADALTLEVTESGVMTDPAKSFATLRALRSLGVHVSIDDFGTGHSSLSYFRELPATELKIDRSFVINLTANAADRHLVQSVIELAHRFGMSVVAEGIQDADTARLLVQMGCDLGQGYHYSRPLPPHEFEQACDAAGNRIEPAVA